MIHDSTGADQRGTDQCEAAKLAVSVAMERIVRIGGCEDFDQIADSRTLGAALVRDAAQSALRFEVAEARSRGRTWTQVAELLGAADVHEAFGQVAVVPRFSAVPRVAWFCQSCGVEIEDFGPGIENPTTRERWHGEDCDRNAAEHETYVVATYGTAAIDDGADGGDR